MQIRDLLTEKRLWKLEAMVAEIGLEEFQAKMAENEVFHLLEISNEADFDKGHLPGAVNVPLVGIRDYALQHFKKYEQIVVYTSASASIAGMVAARLLQGEGFSNVLWLRAGKEGWTNANQPLERDETAEQSPEQ